MRSPAIDRLLPRSAGPRLFPRPRTGHAEYAAALPGGVPFLPDELDNARLIVLAGFGADLTKDPAFWAANFVDITPLVLQDNGRTISIRVGRTDWSSVAYPATCSLAVKNLTGDFTAYNPLARYWPNLVPGTPLWVQLYVNGVYYTRYFGEITGFQPSWDTTGNYAITLIQASGVLRRVQGGTGQGVPIRSTLYRSIVASNPVSYWPIEDGAKSTSIASGIPGGAPATFAGNFNLGVATGLGGSASVATPQPSSSATGPVAAFPSTWSSTTGWTILWVANTPRQPAADTVVLEWFSADTSAAHGQVIITAGGLVVTKLFNSAGTELLGDTGFGFDQNPNGSNYGRWLLWSIFYTPSGSDAVISTRWQDATQLLGSTNVLTGHFPGAPTRWAVSGAASTSDSFSIGHVAVQAFVTVLDGYAAYGRVGETVTARLARVCGDENLPYRTVGAAQDATAMGAQPVDTLYNVLREGESTGAGMLYDGLFPGVAYQPLAARYNQTPTLLLDASQGDLQPPFAPTDDLFGRVNRSVVTRKNGSTVTAEDDTGTLGVNRIGAYTASPSVAPNYSTDDPLPARAGWERWKGTLTGFRYPTILLNLRTIPGKAPGWLSVTPGSLIQVAPPYPAQLPTDALLEVVEGWQEDLATKVWTVAANCSRGDAYRVGVVGDATLGRVDTAGSTLAAAAAVGATSLSVQTNTGPVWTTTATFPADFPFSINVNGIQVTVTAITGVSSPQPFTVTGVTKQLNIGDPVALWKPGVIAL